MSRTFTGVSLPPGSTARIVARGKPSLSMNPDCGVGTTWGDIGHEIPPSGGDINRQGAVSVNLDADADFTDWVNVNQGDSVYLTYRDNGDPAAPSRQLFAERKGFSYSCFTDGNPSLAIYQFDISGSTGLTIDVLGVDVSASTTTIAQGQTVTASALPLNFQGSIVVWSYDTAQYKPAISIPTCANSLSCSYSPTKSGRIQACIRDEYGWYSICGVSPLVSVVQARLEVSCTTVMRGQLVTCTAVNPDGGPLTASQWQFTSPEISGAITESSASLQWQGKAAVSGTVTVTGTAYGLSRTATASLNVTPLNWSQDTVQYSQEELAQSADLLQDRPKVPGDLGTHQGFVEAIPLFDGFEEVQTGPNTGVMFVTKVPVQALSRISLNRVALADTSAFYNLQPATAHGQSCGRPEVVPFLALASSHEGLGSPPPSGSHAGVLRSELNKQVPQATEDAVALLDLQSLENKVAQKAAPGITNAKLLSQDAPPTGSGIVQPIVYCSFKYFK